MKFPLRSLLLSVLLFASASFAQEPAPKGYDVGSCSPDSFAAAHMKVVGKDLQIDKIAPGPDQVKDMADGPVYKFTSEDEDGLHYVYLTKKGSKYEIVIGKKVDLFLVDGDLHAVLLIIPDDDGSKLNENAGKEFKTCLDLVSKVTTPHVDVDKS